MSNDKHQYIYVLKLIPKLLDENNWTETENKIIEIHFKYLQNLKEEGKLILAGRTLKLDKDSFGIVILNVDKEEEARSLMENDPAIKEGIMIAKIYPYGVALISEVNFK